MKINRKPANGSPRPAVGLKRKKSTKSVSGACELFRFADRRAAKLGLSTSAYIVNLIKVDRSNPINLLDPAVYERAQQNNQ